jgi:hypothetical protein
MYRCNNAVQKKKRYITYKKRDTITLERWCELTLEKKNQAMGVPKVITQDAGLKRA